MKRFLMIGILASLLIGSNAFASLARQAVLGNQPLFTSTVMVNSVNGSLWYDDDYNVFYNPAYVNDNKNYVTMNKGLEGGWFKSEFENFAYGVYANRGGSAGAQYGGGAGTSITSTSDNMVAPGFNPGTNYIGTATALSTQRNLDLFIAGDTGIKWGAHAAWAYNRNQLAGLPPTYSGSEITNRYWHFDIGAEVMGLEPFVGMTMFTKYQNTSPGQTTTADLNEFDVGVRYKYEGWTPYIMYHKFRESGVQVGAVTQTQTMHNIYGIGIGHDTKVADGVHFMKNLGVWLNSVTDDAASPIAAVGGGVVSPDAGKDFKDYIVPLNLALEAEATGWLTLRSGVVFDIVNERKYTSTNNQTGSTTAMSNVMVSNAGTVKVRVGSTLKFGKLHIDSAFGNGSAPANANGETLDNSSVGFDSQLFGLLSASYHW